MSLFKLPGYVNRKIQVPLLCFICKFRGKIRFCKKCLFILSLLQASAVVLVCIVIHVFVCGDIYTSQMCYDKVADTYLHLVNNGNVDHSNLYLIILVE
jgi:hypothetical protein